MMFCSLLLLGVKISHLPSARLRKEIVKKLKTKEVHAKEKVKEVLHKKLKPHRGSPSHKLQPTEQGDGGPATA